MDLYEIKLLRHEDVAEGTRAFYFERPAGLEFTAGQFGNFSLIDAAEEDEAGNMRSFSFASSPHDRELMIATRMRPSAFKRQLAALPAGATLELQAPFGELVLEDDDRPAVFLAGGIGITPFRSMLRHCVHAGAQRPMQLIYANRTPASSAFLAELREIETKLPRFKLACVVESPAPGWQGDTGFITAALLQKHVGDLAAPVFYVVGPPAMTAAMRELLMNAGVDDDAVHVEDFAGY